MATPSDSSPKESWIRGQIHPSAHPLRDPDRVRGQRRVFFAGLSGAGRPAANRRAAGRDRRDDRDHQARLRLRQAAAGAVPDLARAGADRRFRHVDRHQIAGPRRDRAGAVEHRAAGGFRGAARVLDRLCDGRAGRLLPGNLDRPGRDRRRGVRGQPAELLARHRAGDRLRRRTLDPAGDRHGIAGIERTSTRCAGAMQGF